MNEIKSGEGDAMMDSIYFLCFLKIYPNGEIIEYYITIDTIDRNLLVIFFRSVVEFYY